MKKFILAASLLAVTFMTANAQDETTTGAGFKPESGDITAEVGLSPGAGFIPGTTLSSSGPGLGGVLRFRYFFAEDMAVRVGLNLTRTSTKTEFPQTSVDPNPNPGATIQTAERKTSNGSTLLNLGVEKHFTGTDRLSTFAGADLLIAMSSSKDEGENLSSPTGTPTAGASYEIKNATGSTGIGLRVVFGADYYIVKKVYLGIEGGWGFLTSKDKDEEAKVTTGGAGSTTSTTTTTGSRGMTIAPTVLLNLRLGFRF